MRSTGPGWPRRAGGESRRQSEVEACLAHWELLGRPRRVQAVQGSGLAGAGLGRRLRGALEELGPVFSDFGLYLASRVDLLSAGDALELSALPERVPALPVGAVRERLAAELGSAAHAFAGLEAEPFESRLLLQTHRGRLAGGERVIVRLVRIDMEEAVEADLELLPLIGEALVAQGWTAGAAKEAAAAFRQSLRERTDLGIAVQNLDFLAGDAQVFSRLAVPAIFRDLTGARLLTTADLGGVALGEAPRAASRELVRNLCTVWLHQVLAGRLFPVELGGEDVRALPDGRIGFQGVAFARLLPATQADFKEALVAVAFRDPDGACSALVRETARESSACSVAELRLHLRQIVPFRDGAWSPGGDSLAENLFVYARTARSCGYRPRRPLVAFYRGLFAVSLAGRRLAPECDPLLDGLQDLRMLTGFSQVRDAMSFDNWGGQLDRYAMIMAALPQRLDALLTLAAEGRGPARPPEGDRPRRRAEGSHLVPAASRMVLAALALLLHHFVPAGALAGRGETVAATLFLIVGGILLWTLSRTR